ncbi:MAG: hypothetical protein KC994_17555 [Candidatus Omnitrophica bacterium]|nr:hypothetical protein [Candidatus Omnitrophota bacterium]
MPQFENCVLVGKEQHIFQNTDAPVTYSNIQGGYPGEGNIDADPLFVDPANGDYHLMPGSPCIEAGTNTGLVEDFDGKGRPLGDYDMGAFEYPFLRGDIDLDGRVDDNDLMILSRDWKKVSGA